MSDKQECPGCESYTSSVRMAFLDGEPCPHCGLSASAVAELRDAQRRSADTDLTERYERAVVALDEANRELAHLRGVLDMVRRAVRNAEPA